MKLYLAGLHTSNFNQVNGRLYEKLTPAEQYHRDNVKHYLESYHYIHRQSYVDRIRADGIQVFLDSGAFSAFTKGVKVDMKAYCRYIEENIDIIQVIDGDVCASVLDHIGSAQGTYENQLAMEKLGVRPLPCFHYGEDERYLEWYIANYDYITIGGMVPISTPQLKMWLDRLWEKYMIDGSGRPKIKFHGFGLTTLSLMKRYPWYSVDSSSWVQIAANGSVLLPGHGVVATSSSSPNRKVANQHLNTFPEAQRKALVEKLEAPGFDTDRLQDEYLARWVFNCYAFTKINEDIDHTESVFKGDQALLF